jgi:hypothetical protein
MALSDPRHKEKRIVEGQVSDRIDQLMLIWRKNHGRAQICKPAGTGA